MIEEAIRKIKDEMEKDKDPGIQQIGLFLLKQIEINKDAAKNIVKEGKTIAGSYKYMGSKALEKVKERKGTQTVHLTDSEGYKLVMDYFGFEAVQDRMIEVEVDEIKETAGIKKEDPVSSSDEIDFNVSVEDFL